MMDIWKGHKNDQECKCPGQKSKYEGQKSVFPLKGNQSGQRPNFVKMVSKVKSNDF